MKKKTIRQKSISDFSEFLKPYLSGWVAFSPSKHKVIAAAETLRETRAAANRHGFFNPLFIKIIPPDKGYLSTPLIY